MATSLPLSYRFPFPLISECWEFLKNLSLRSSLPTGTHLAVSLRSSHLILGLQALSNEHLLPDLSARLHLELQLSAGLCSRISNCLALTGFVLPLLAVVEETDHLDLRCRQTYARNPCQPCCSPTLRPHIAQASWFPGFPIYCLHLAPLFSVNQPFGSYHPPQAGYGRCGLP